MTMAVECPVVSEHQKPGFKRTLRWIELLGGTEHVYEHVLQRIFRFRIVAQGSACNSKYERTVPLEKDRQCVRLICEEIGDQLFVGLQAKSHISNNRVANGRCYDSWLGGALILARLR